MGIKNLLEYTGLIIAIIGIIYLIVKDLKKPKEKKATKLKINFLLIYLILYLQQSKKECLTLKKLDSSGLK
jgi:uncharacterized membrane protein